MNKLLLFIDGKLRLASLPLEDRIEKVCNNLAHAVLPQEICPRVHDVLPSKTHTLLVHGSVREVRFYELQARPMELNKLVDELWRVLNFIVPNQVSGGERERERAREECAHLE